MMVMLHLIDYLIKGQRIWGSGREHVRRLMGRRNTIVPTTTNHLKGTEPVIRFYMIWQLHRGPPGASTLGISLH